MTQWIISSSVLIVIVVILRFALRGKISLRLQYALWALVLVRLLVPVSFGSTVLSVMNAVPQDSAPAILSPLLSVGIPDSALILPDGETVPTEQISPADPEEPTAQAAGGSVTGAENHAVDWGIILKAVWLLGAAAIGLCLLIANIRFAVKLKKARHKLDMEICRLPVYLSQQVETPCLFGLFRPAIYVTTEAAENETVLRYALEHELTHFYHGDHVWSLLRCLCLALHWYNPLVWLAVILSRRDAELACDEGTIKRIGEDKRLEYGNALIDLTCEKCQPSALLLTSTTMTGDRKGIRERIRLISKRPKMLWITVVSMVLAAVAAVGCTFTGAESGTEAPAENEAAYANMEIRIPETAEAYPALSEYLRASAAKQAARHNEIGAQRGFSVVSVEVMLFEAAGPVSVKDNFASQSGRLHLFRPEYCICYDNPENVTPSELAGDASYMAEKSSDGSVNTVTFWDGAEQPYIFILENDEENTANGLCCLYTLTAQKISEEYNTPEMLKKYGDMYTAAAMELYTRYQSIYTINGVTMVLKPGFVIREDGYRCFVNEDGAMVGAEILSQDDERLMDYAPAYNTPFDLPQDDYGSYYCDSVWEAKYHYYAYRLLDQSPDSDFIRIELMCPENLMEEYAEIFPLWASTAAASEAFEYTSSALGFTPNLPK